MVMELRVLNSNTFHRRDHAFRDTDLGVFPVGWELVPFRDVFHFLPTATNSRADLSPDGDTYYVHYGDVHTRFHDHLDFSTSIIPRVAHEKCSNAAPIRNGDWIMADASEDLEGLCKSVEVTGLKGQGAAVSGLHTYLLREKKQVFAPGFKGYLGSSILLRKQYLRVMTGMKVYSVSKGALRDLLLPVPPLDEQNRIVELLNDISAHIVSLEQLIEKKRLIKQGAMHELLSGRRRLPGFSGEWSEKTFDEVFTFLPTATNSRADLGPEGDVYYVHYGDIHTRFHGVLDFTSVKPPKIKREKCPNAAQLRNGDWIMADASEDFDGVGKSVEVRGLGADEVAVSGLHTFLLREKTPMFAPGFKGYLGYSEFLRKQYLRVMTGMKVYGVSKTALRDLLIPVPPVDEQASLVEVFDDMTAEIASLEVKLAKAHQIKQGMMQELLTGRIRLV